MCFFKQLLRGFLVTLLAAAFAASAAATAPGNVAGIRQGLPEIAVADLPREARETLALIRQGGPFPYERDGAIFGNYEKLLPPRERGYYREYTVRTPAVANRGARRLVAGKNGEFYYTDDHYKSFRRIRQ
ncbi:MAG: ribonuclease domain-containing protein [Burkholderiales bacterium]